MHTYGLFESRTAVCYMADVAPFPFASGLFSNERVARRRRRQIAYYSEQHHKLLQKLDVLKSKHRSKGSCCMIPYSDQSSHHITPSNHCKYFCRR